MYRSAGGPSLLLRISTPSLANLESSQLTHKYNALCYFLTPGMDQSPFEKLAPELRNAIWEMSLNLGEPLILNKIETTTPPPITATCRQIREETLFMFYSDRIVELHLPSPNYKDFNMSSGACGRLYYKAGDWLASLVCPCHHELISNFQVRLTVDFSKPTLDLFEHFQRNDPKLHYALPFLLRQLAPLLERYGCTDDKQPLLECTQNTLINSSAALEPECYEKYGDMGIKCSYVLNKIPWPKDDKAAEEGTGANGEEASGAAEEEEDKAGIEDGAQKADGVTEEEDEVDDNESAEEDEALFE
ncbi:hypothetical protein LTR10_008232 [Elasticomyces elasticus]|nr:hypothetical protein LTR10_008232 [Elasticomyces elasticus]KAK4967108.1 hypothetical protein LTR42_010456 [Elasticomyces elasticus]